MNKTATTTATRRAGIAAEYPEYAKALDLRDKGKRGPGKRMTDAELETYIVQAIHQRPTYGAGRELEIAYWVEKLAVTRDRFLAAYNRIAGIGSAPKIQATGSSDPASVPTVSAPAPKARKRATAPKATAEVTPIPKAKSTKRASRSTRQTKAVDRVSASA